jgi:hypothetical protein
VVLPAGGEEAREQSQGVQGREHTAGTCREHIACPTARSPVGSSFFYPFLLTSIPIILQNAQKEEREARDAEQLAKTKKLTPMQALTGGITGLAIAFVLYGFTQTVMSSFDGKPVPESYQARQITITVRTIVSGLAYLATFVYAANGTGLCALAAQKWLDKLTGVDLIDEQAAKWEEEKKAQEREEQ